MHEFTRMSSRLRFLDARLIAKRPDLRASNAEEGDMGLDDLVNKGKDLYEQNKDKVDEALHSDQAEQVSDNVLGGVADFAKKILPDSVDGKIDEVRDNNDGAIGNDR